MLTTSYNSIHSSNYNNISPFIMNQNLKHHSSSNQNYQSSSNSSFSQYVLNQNFSRNSEIQNSPYSSPTGNNNSNLPHSSITLPSIHSLNIPSFPHIEESSNNNINLSQRQNSSNSGSISDRSSSIHSPPLLIPKSSSFSDEPILDLNHHTHHPQPYNYTHTTTNTINNNNHNQIINNTIKYPTSPIIKSPNSQQSNNFIISTYKSNSSSPSFNLDYNQQQKQNDMLSYNQVTSQQQQQQQQQQPSTPTSSFDETSNQIKEESPSNSSKKNWKPRKKRQCPECKLYFSNLATHKSTHLKPTNRPHICDYCQRGFARPNDLFRHVKCHWKEIGSDKGQFKCPFKSLNNNSNSNESTTTTQILPDHCCHNTGIFSRCDTFKNHLKAIHFQYPNGTKKDQRNKVSGKCRMCLQNFQHVDDWIHNHIETNSCPNAINMIKKV
ncbi:STP4 [Candida jiufengensis]|uniref:STP4 n=1 Tax=Candida jiufengensis TaxID=497108 RepID=UPI0022240D7F|nr:STP4 [Candida jiufengensis]KAI5951783.1 STP4 [Candida jiufengensis]